MRVRFKYLILLVALLVAGCAGYFSVWGLSQLFAGASTAVIIMATVLEVGKIITTTALHRYWKKISNGLKIYLTISVAVLMLITSAGIYGFLSNAYQKTANKMEIHDGEVGLLTNKKEAFETKITTNNKTIELKNKRVDQLTNLRATQENRFDSAKTNRNKDKIRNDISQSTLEIQKLSNEIDDLNTKNASFSDSIGFYSSKALKLNSTSEVSGEVGPLKYISELTGQPMGKVVNVLILLLIFVFDPLAIALILITNRIFDVENVVTKDEDTTEKLPEIKNDGVNDGVNEELTSEPEIDLPGVLEEEIEEVKEVTEPKPLPKKEPIQNDRIKLEDIKEIKDRGYSVEVPQPRGSNTIERIGSNKIVKNGDNNKVIFKRN